MNLIKKLISEMFRYGIYSNQQLLSDIVSKNVAEYYEGVAENKCFEQFRNINAGKTVVLMGTGPTVEKFIPIKDAIYIGVNRCALYKKVKYDYMFMQDYAAVKEYINEMKKEEFNETIKFYGIIPMTYKAEIFGGASCSIPNSIALEHHAYRYYVPMNWGFQDRYPLNISNGIMAVAGSVIGPAFQFALYTNPKTLYIVGCDLTSGHFGGDNIPSSDLSDLVFWKNNKEFAEVWYPDTEIISVNPIGLKGLFDHEIYSGNGGYVENINV